MKIKNNFNKTIQSDGISIQDIQNKMLQELKSNTIVTDFIKKHKLTKEQCLKNILTFKEFMTDQKTNQQLV